MLPFVSEHTETWIERWDLSQVIEQTRPTSCYSSLSKSESWVNTDKAMRDKKQLNKRNANPGWWIYLDDELLRDGIKIDQGRAHEIACLTMWETGSVCGEHGVPFISFSGKTLWSCQQKPTHAWSLKVNYTWSPMKRSYNSSIELSSKFSIKTIPLLKCFDR